MDARQLMIGDYILVDNKVCKVTAVYSNGTIDYEGNGVSGTTDNPQPIPLTPEILEKNGFVSMEINSGYTLLQNNTMIELRTGWPDENVAIWLDWDEDNDGVYANYILPHPKFVHELQHICYIDRNIEI